MLKSRTQLEFTTVNNNTNALLLPVNGDCVDINDNLSDRGNEKMSERKIISITTSMIAKTFTSVIAEA